MKPTVAALRRALKDLERDYDIARTITNRRLESLGKQLNAARLALDTAIAKRRKVCTK